jgi:chitodextrinase
VEAEAAHLEPMMKFPRRLHPTRTRLMPSRLRGSFAAFAALTVVVVGPGSVGMGSLTGRHSNHDSRVVAMSAQPSRAPLAPALQARATRLTDEVRALADALNAPQAHRAKLSRRLRVLSRRRERTLERLLVRDPAAARTLLLPARTRHTLARLSGAEVERPVALRGWYRVWHHDDFRHPTHDSYLDQLVTRDGKVVTLHGAADRVSVRLTFARLKPARLAVRGWRLGDELLATHVQTLHSGRQLAASSATTASSVGPINTAVIVADFADSATSFDMNALKTLFQGSPGADVVSYFKEASYGKASIVPSFYGPYRLAENAQYGCGTFDTGELMRLANPDIDYTQFKRVIFVGNCTGYGATAMNELPTSTPDGTVNLATIAEDADYSKKLYTQVHELSHTLGGFNSHASWFVCSPDAFQPPTAFDKGCDTAEYADHFDVLGGGPSHWVGHLDPYHKWNSGWLSSSQFPTVTTTGTYTLAPYESPGSGIVALNIPRASSGTNFTVEYRQPTGFDSWMGSCNRCTVTQGASIRLSGLWVSGSGGGSDTELIDTTPGTSDDGGYFPTDDALDAALLPGKSFTDPEYGITITAVSAGASGLAVKVTVPSQACTRGAPRVTAPSPASQTGSGRSFTSTFTVTNTDSSGCPANRFRFLPAGGSVSTQYVADPDAFTLAPGASVTLTLGVTLPKTTTTGTYALVPGSVASNTLGDNETVVPALTYQLTAAADTTPPGAPASVVATALGSGVVSLAWAPSTDSVGVLGYRVIRNGSILPSTTGTTFVDSGRAAGATYSYSVQAFDARGNISASATASVTTPAKKDFTRPTPPLTTATATDRTVTLSWSPSLDLDGTVAAYRLSPCLVAQCTLPATATSLQLTGLPTQTRYDLTVSAVDADGNTAYSEVVTVYTAPLGDSAPPAPQRLYSPSGTFAGAKLTWTAGSGATAYQIYRNNRLYATVAATSFTDPTPGGHEYFVQAVDASGALSPPTARMWALGPYSASADATPPTASVTAPSKGATVSGTATMTAQASDNVGVSNVNFYVDGLFQGATYSSPFTYHWDTTRVSNGVHWINVVAFDNAGNYSSDGGYTVTTANGVSGGGGSVDATPPSIAVTAPANGATVSGGVAASASASDNVGVTKVEFSVDGALLATSIGAPYGFTWDASKAAPGPHTITATAYDAAGNKSTASVTVTVPTPPDATPPAVSITSPANGATISGAVQVQANATDDVGVTRVELSVDGSPVSSLSAGPWTFGLDTTTLANGTHTLTLEAYDAAANSSSGEVSVNVQNTPGDTSAPSKPSGLKSAVTGTTQVALFWTPTADNVGVVGYDVYRDGTPVAQTTFPNYLDSGLTPGTSHVYSVRARDAAGNTSIPSSNLNAKTVALSTSSTGTLAGVVYNAIGRPASNVIVQLSGNGITKSAKTNTSGAYKFTSLPPGPYTLTITSSSATAAAVALVTATAVSGQTILLVSG